MIDVRFTEDDEEISFACVLQVFCHVQVGVHPRFKHGDATELAKLGGVRLVVESAGDQYIEVCIARFAWRLPPGRRVDCAKLGTDENSGALFYFAFQIPPFGTNEIARPRSERSECDLVFLVSLLHTGRF
jgi:hypothetical protein